MKKKIGIGVLSIIGGLFLSVKSFGQADPIFTETVLEINPRLFVAILGGLLLALGFQLVLTNLSVAAGVSAIGNIRDKANEPSGDKHHEEHSKKDEKSGTPTGVKFMSAAGAWTMITTAIALFFACFFAVKLSLIPDNAIGVSLGLVIWATFFMAMFYLESKALSWLVGGVFGTAFKAIKEGFGGLSNAIGKSETGKSEHVAERTVEKVRDEVTAMFSHNDIGRKIEEYVNQLKPREPDFGRIRNDLANLLNEIRVEERLGENLGEKDFFLKVAEKQPNLSKKDVSKLGDLYDEAKSSVEKVKSSPGDTMVDKAINAIPGGSKIKEQIEQYLKQSGEEQLNPDLLKAELEEIFKHPSKATEILNSKSGSFNKESVLSVVCAQPGVDCNQARKVADKVEEAINKIRDKVQGNIQHVENKSNSLKEQSGQTGQQMTGKKDEMLNSVEQKIQAFLDRTGRSEVSYGSLRWDFEKIMNDPKVAPEVLRDRLNKMDAESVVALLAANENISRAEAENIVGKYEDAKANVIVKIDEMQNEVKRRVEEAKQTALQQAENTRKTAASAAWWIVGSMVISGLAAALGGVLAF